LGGVASSEAPRPALFRDAIAAPGGGGEPGVPVWWKAVMDEEGWDAVATEWGMGSEGISVDATTRGGAGGVLLAKMRFTLDGEELFWGVP